MQEAEACQKSFQWELKEMEEHYKKEVARNADAAAKLKEARNNEVYL